MLFVLCSSLSFSILPALFPLWYTWAIFLGETWPETAFAKRAVRRLLAVYLLAFGGMGGISAWFGHQYGIWQGMLMGRRNLLEIQAQLPPDSLDGNVTWENLGLLPIAARYQGTGEGPPEGTQTFLDPRGRAGLYLPKGRYHVTLEGMAFPEDRLIRLAGDANAILESQGIRLEMPLQVTAVTEWNRRLQFAREQLRQGNLDTLLTFGKRLMEAGEDPSGSPQGLELMNLLEQIEVVDARLTEAAAAKPGSYETYITLYAEALRALQEAVGGASPPSVVWKGEAVDLAGMKPRFRETQAALVKNLLERFDEAVEAKTPDEAAQIWMFLTANQELLPADAESEPQYFQPFLDHRDQAATVMTVFMVQLRKTFDEGKTWYGQGRLSQAQQCFRRLQGDIDYYRRAWNVDSSLLVGCNSFLDDIAQLREGDRFYEAGRYPEARQRYQAVTNPTIALEEKLQRLPAF